MKACGVIAEYNPFHNGHRYQLSEARRMTKSDVMVVAMSGNFVQRGAPALLDKWTRAEIALRNGADIVVEMPILGSVQSADLFARAGIRLLQAMQCDAFAFGAEEGTAEDFISHSRFLREHEAEINRIFQTYRNDGRTYAAQLETAIAEILSPQGSAISFSTSNNQLGLAYVKENEQFPEPMETAIVLRRGAGHNDSEAFGEEFASGTAIREWALHHGKQSEGNDMGRFVPEETLEALERLPLLDWAAYWGMLQYQLMLLSHAELRNIYQVEEGIEYRLKKEAEDAADFMAFIRRTKNKRWTWARLQRVCTYILLGITKAEAHAFQEKADTIRLLGFTESGRRYLNSLKKNTETPIVTKLREPHTAGLQLEIRSDRIYRLGGFPVLDEQNFTRSPIYIRNELHNLK